MRRAILAVTIGGVLLTGAACDNDAADTAGATTAAPSATAAPSQLPSSPPPDYTANTKLVCGKVEKIFNDGLQGFATDLGKMIAHKEAKQTAEADAAQRSASTALKNVGTQVKNATATADDPALRTAGAASAAKFAKSAGDDKFFDKIKTTKDLNSIIEGQLAEWFTPVAGYCST
jgi:hypothetical protein